MSLLHRSQIHAQAVRESDSAIVPEKSPNNGSPVAAEAMEGRALAKRNAEEEAVTQAQNWTLASFGLDGVRQRACLPHIRICHPFPDVRFDATQ